MAMAPSEPSSTPVSPLRSRPGPATRYQQLRELRSYAAREGYLVVEEVMDNGHSGADPPRPGLRRMMRLAEAGAIEVVLAKKRNRLFRSRLYRLLWD